MYRKMLPPMLWNPFIYLTNIHRALVGKIINLSRCCHLNAEQWSAHNLAIDVRMSSFQAYCPRPWPPLPCLNLSLSSASSSAYFCCLAHPVSSPPVSCGSPKVCSDISLLCLVSSNQVSAAPAHPAGQSWQLSLSVCWPMKACSSEW